MRCCLTPNNTLARSIEVACPFLHAIIALVILRIGCLKTPTANPDSKTLTSSLRSSIPSHRLTTGTAASMPTQVIQGVYEVDPEKLKWPLSDVKTWIVANGPKIRRAQAISSKWKTWPQIELALAFDAAPDVSHSIWHYKSPFDAAAPQDAPRLHIWVSSRDTAAYPSTGLTLRCRSYNETSLEFKDRLLDDFRMIQNYQESSHRLGRVRMLVVGLTSDPADLRMWPTSTIPPPRHPISPPVYHKVSDIEGVNLASIQCPGTDQLFHLAWYERKNFE